MKYFTTQDTKTTSLQNNIKFVPAIFYFIYYTPGMNFILFGCEIVDGLIERISEKVYLKNRIHPKNIQNYLVGK